MKNQKYSRRLSWTFLAIFLSLGILASCIQNKGSSSSTPLTEKIYQGELSEDQIATLSSLKKVDVYPLYTMRYYGAYSQSSSSKDNPLYATNLPKSDLNPFSSPWACSLFTSLASTDNMLYGRNFDWEYSPALLLFTDPPDGYGSVSMVDIAYLGFGGDRATTLLDLPLDERRSLLNAPFWPFDGMNERGLVVGMAAVPESEMPYDQDKESIGSLGVIRQMLDHAANVDEAVAILQSYNVDMGGGPPIHYLIADSSGRAVLVEFYEGEMVVISNETDYHLATNFLRASVGESAAGQCQRYDELSQRLAETEGRMTARDGMNLLEEVSQGGTQWSVVYEIGSGNVNVVMGREYDDAHVLHLRLETDE